MPRLGAKQLHHASEQPGETLLVPRTCVTQCSRVSAQQFDQRQFPGAREREQPWAAVHLAQVRGARVSLQDQHYHGWQGEPGSRLRVRTGCSLETVLQMTEECSFFV